jgi:nucleotide-binding universal stress UspA family protein
MPTIPTGAERAARGGRGSSSSSDDAPFGRIAACLDGSEMGERILPHALAVARSLGAPITLLRVLEGREPGGAPLDPLAWGIRRRETRDYLARLAERGAGEESVEFEVIEGHAAEEICLWVRHHDVKLTVLCSHGTSGETAWSLASTARKLVEGAPGSFLLVPAAAATRGRVARYRRVMVPFDGSARAESVVPLAMRLAEANGAELILSHVVPRPELTEIGPPDADDRDLQERLVRRNERVANEYLDRLRARFANRDAPVRALVLRGGDVRSRLARLIGDEDVDLVVLSAHGRGARADVPLGSVATYLVAHTEVPLLIIRQPAATMARREAAQDRQEVRLPSQTRP